MAITCFNLLALNVGVIKCRTCRQWSPRIDVKKFSTTSSPDKTAYIHNKFIVIATLKIYENSLLFILTFYKNLINVYISAASYKIALYI